jgi:RNase P subunit p30
MSGRRQQRRARDVDETPTKRGGVGFCDLYVPCAGQGNLRRGKATSSSSASGVSTLPPPPLLLSSLLDRYRATNVTTIALTHVVYGSPSPSRDAVEQVFPSEWIQELTARGRTSDSTGPTPTPLRILTRLHAVVESASDLRHYQHQPQQQQLQQHGPSLSTSASRGAGGNEGGGDIGALLRGYDLVSIAPRNDAAFQAACEVSKDASMFEIVTLEYFSGTAIGSRAMLPFKVKAGIIRSAVQNGLVVEVPYAPALLNHHESPSYRRAFVQTLHELRSASLGQKLRAVLSSGPRQTTARSSSSMGGVTGKDSDGADDAGALALRMPGDLVNVFTTVLRWNRADALACVAASPMHAVQTSSRIRRFGPAMAAMVRSVHVEPAGVVPAKETPPVPKNKRRREPIQATIGLEVESKLPRMGDDTNDDTNGDDDEGTAVYQDGFISLN